MRVAVQRRIGLVAAIAALLVGFTAFELMRAPARDASVRDEPAATPRDEPPPPLVPAARAPAFDPLESKAPSTDRPPTALERAERERANRRWRVHGRLVGLVPSVPWRSPVFVVPRGSAEETSSTIAVRNARPDPADRQHSSDVLKAPRTRPLAAWDPVTEPIPSFESARIADAEGRFVDPSHAAVAADGSFEIDGSSIFGIESASPPDRRGKTASTPSELDFFANDPGYMPELRTLEIPPDAAETGVDFELTVPVVVAARVTGLVDARDRGARARQVGLAAAAGLFSGTLDGDASQALDVGIANDRYLLRAPVGGTCTVVLAAEGYVPAQLPVELAVGEERESPTVVFERGAKISGNVVWPAAERGAWRFRGEGAAVTALAATGGGRAVELPGQPLLYANGRLERRSVSITTAPPSHGRAPFVISGLADGHGYRIFLGTLSLSDFDGPPSRRPSVVAPADDVRIDFELAYVGIDVLCNDRPAAGATVSLGSATATTDVQGRASFLVPPFQASEMHVESDGCEPASELVKAGPAGSVTRGTAKLVRHRPLATLALTVRCEGTAEVRFARVRFEPRQARSPAAFTREGIAVDSTVTFKDLPEGRFRITFEMVTGTWPDRRGAIPLFPDTRPEVRRRQDLLDPALEVELDASNPCERSVDLHEGAALLITCRDARGTPLTAKCALTDAHDKPVEFGLVRDEREIDWEPVDSWRVRETGAGIVDAQTLLGGEPSRTDPALPPGHYTLTVSRSGFTSAVVPVELARGKAMELDVVLQRIP
jgi:hypothetical protein